MTKQLNMKAKALIAAAVLILAMAVACTEEVPLAPEKTGTISVFPNEMGSKWHFQVVDNLQVVDTIKPDFKFDTVVVTISNIIYDPETKLNATVWTYVSRGFRSAIKPVVFSGDTVYIYWHWENRDRIGLVFPFKVNDRWRTGGLFSGDSTVVIDKTTLRVPAGNFENVFVLENTKRTTVPTDHRTVTIWFVPNLGPIKMHFRESHEMSLGDTTWTLVTHNFPEFIDN